MPEAKQIEMFTDEPLSVVRVDQVYLCNMPVGVNFAIRQQAREQGKLYYTTTGRTPESVVYNAQTGHKFCKVIDLQPAEE